MLVVAGIVVMLVGVSLMSRKRRFYQNYGRIKALVVRVRRSGCRDRIETVSTRGHLHEPIRPACVFNVANLRTS